MIRHGLKLYVEPAENHSHIWQVKIVDTIFRDGIEISGEPVLYLMVSSSIPSDRTVPLMPWVEDLLAQIATQAKRVIHVNDDLIHRSDLGSGADT